MHEILITAIGACLVVLILRLLYSKEKALDTYWTRHQSKYGCCEGRKSPPAIITPMFPSVTTNYNVKIIVSRKVKMETDGSSETSLTDYYTTRRHIPVAFKLPP
jgi:hypothetical protein